MQLVRFAAGLGIAALTILLMVEGRQLLVPFAMSVMLWFVIDAIAMGFRRLPVGDWSLPEPACRAASFLAVIGSIWLVIDLIGASLDEVVKAAPEYQQNLERIMQQVSAWLGIEELPTIQQLIERVEYGPLMGNIAGALAGMASSTGIVLIYLIFLMMEQKNFATKTAALFPESEEREKFLAMFRKIGADTRKYIRIKTVASAATGLLSYTTLAIAGVDSAPFWGVLIFLLNYIPTFGSILGVIFPSLMILVQFETLTTFIVVVPVLVAIQVLIGNIIEPKFQGGSLNLSPLVVLLSLGIWGSIWGLAGMFLAVPLTVILMIIFSNVPQTRAIAILLSSKGDLNSIEHE